jgi:hypothetical protein
MEQVMQEKDLTVLTHRPGPVVHQTNLLESPDLGLWRPDAHDRVYVHRTT